MCRLRITEILDFGHWGITGITGIGALRVLGRGSIRTCAHFVLRQVSACFYQYFVSVQDRNRVAPDRQDWVDFQHTVISILAASAESAWIPAFFGLNGAE